MEDLRGAVNYLITFGARDNDSLEGVAVRYSVPLQNLETAWNNVKEAVQSSLREREGK